MTMQATETAPIQKTVLVPLPVEKAFALFTDALDTWWPFATHSIGGEEAETAVFDTDAKRLYERDADGTEREWADILAWEPPNRFLLGWHVNQRSRGTEVEVRFEPEDDGTRVKLEHRGWERVGGEAAEERASYDTGWEFVLGRFTDAAA